MIQLQYLEIQWKLFSLQKVGRNLVVFRTGKFSKFLQSKKLLPFIIKSRIIGTLEQISLTNVNVSLISDALKLSSNYLLLDFHVLKMPWRKRYGNNKK